MDRRIDWAMRFFIDKATAALSDESRPEIAKQFFERGVPLHVALRVLK